MNELYKDFLSSTADGFQQGAEEDGKFIPREDAERIAKKLVRWLFPFYLISFGFLKVVEMLSPTQGESVLLLVKIRG